MAVKPWEPREIPTHSSVFPAGHIQSIPSLKSSPQQALDYEKSPAGASHMQQTHPCSTTSDASPFQVWEAQNLFHVHRGTACLRRENWGLWLCTGELKLWSHLELEKMTMSIPLVHCNTKIGVSTFAYVTLTIGKEHIQRVSTQIKFPKQFSSVKKSSLVVWQNWCFLLFDVESLELAFNFLGWATYQCTACQL